MARQSLLHACVARGVAEWGNGSGLRATLKVTPRASRLAAFVVMWAQLLDERHREPFTIEDYAAAGFESRATAYRRLADFRELFPHEHDPNRIAAELLDVAEARQVGLSMELRVAL